MLVREDDARAYSSRSRRVGRSLSSRCPHGSEEVVRALPNDPVMSSPGAMPGAARSELIMPSLRPSFARLCRLSKPVRLLFWECADPRIVDAAALVSETGTVKVLFLGGEEELSSTIEDPGAARAEILAVGTVLRTWLERSGSSTSALPRSRCELAAAALAMHLVDAVVGGVATSSADVLRAGLPFVGLLPCT